MPTNLCTGPAHMRGCVVGLATGALAVAAHGAAGGGYPSSTGVALLLLTTLVTGWASGSVVADVRGRYTHRAVTPGLGILLPLAAGQLAGHWALTGLTGHHSGADTALGESVAGPLPAAMLAAHLLAVLLCALVIAATERLYREASAALRVLLAAARAIPRVRRALTATNVSTPRYRAPNGASGPRAPPAHVATDVPNSFGEKVFDPCPTGFPRPCAAG
ncbi:hypothetical protein [Nocardia sp. NPDC019395]|uniref:hypothetical protein n=1 Tax=Nocardia sp. NPDC019395 TaxID=3154686 RepID=UPI00340D7768